MLDAALAFTSTRMQQALATGDALAPLDPAFSARAGMLQRPCGRAPLAAGFGPRTRIDGVTDHRHPGLSWTVDADTPAAAVAPGHVVFAGPVDGLGLVVVLAHSEFEHTVYAQLRRLAVLRGQTLSASDMVGVAGARTPDGERECYFEIRLEGVPVDPSPWLEPR
jgi:septal ring factor EnvC (AmiA/AmiB activator)